jgi:ribosomal protein S18
MVEKDGMIKVLSEKMTELAPFAVPSKKYNAEKAEEYYKTLKLFQEAKEKQKKEPVKHCDIVMFKAFVNSFGEATKREITNISYDKQQKRLSKEIINYIS